MWFCEQRYCELYWSSIGYNGDVKKLTQSEQLQFPLEEFLMIKFRISGKLIEYSQDSKYGKLPPVGRIENGKDEKGKLFQEVVEVNRYIKVRFKG